MSRINSLSWQQHTHALRNSIGRLSCIAGPTATARTTRSSIHAIKHWQRKFMYPNIRSGPHGGAWDGNRLFTRTMQQIVEFHAWHVLKYDPKYSLHALSQLLLLRVGVAPSRMWLSRMLKRWRWSFKNINHKHVRKFLPQSIQYYGQYLVSIRNVQVNRIKYMDEASFSSRDLVRRRGLSARGDPIQCVSDYDLSETIKVSVLTSICWCAPCVCSHAQRRTSQ